MKQLTAGEGMRLISPLPYAVVTCLDPDGRPNAIGVSWLTITSIEPFMFLISIAPQRYSHEGIEKNGEFVINFPSQDQAQSAWICGVTSGRSGDKIQRANLKLIPSLKLRTPCMAEATAVFECKVVNAITTGDHTVFVGEVVAVRGNEHQPSHLYYLPPEELMSCDYQGHVELQLLKD